MAIRYDMRKERQGWTVFDIWTGWPAVVAGVHQTDLLMDDADYLVDLLNGLHVKGTQLDISAPSGIRDV